MKIPFIPFIRSICAVLAVHSGLGLAAGLCTPVVQGNSNLVYLWQLAKQKDSYLLLNRNGEIFTIDAELGGIKTANQIPPLKQYGPNSDEADFDPYSQQIMVNHWRQSIDFFEAITGKQLQTFPIKNRPLRGQLIPGVLDSFVIANDFYVGIERYYFSNGSYSWYPEGSGNPSLYGRLAIDPGGKRFVLAKDRQLNFFSTSNNSKQLVTVNSPYPLRHQVFSSNGKFFVAYYQRYDGAIDPTTVYLWNVEMDLPSQLKNYNYSFTENDGAIGPVAVSDDGQTLVIAKTGFSGPSIKEIILVDLNTGKFLNTLRIGTSTNLLEKIYFLSSGKGVITLSQDISQRTFSVDLCKWQ